MVEDRMDRGWDGYILSFMFDHIGGSEHNKIRVMQKEAERVYDKVAWRSIRNYKKPVQRSKLGIWIVTPDYPVSKHEKMDLGDATLNDGLHLHAIAAHYPRYRFDEEDLVEHFDINQEHYVQRGYPLQRVHVTRIERDPG